ncbi:MAG TPA: hypothetical protein VM736_07640 [Gemmatimonadales bacterium]|nr:hypothetical protein [Gemmatimonadales bacterium]
MRLSVFAALLGPLATPLALPAAQGPPPRLEQRLDAQTIATLRPILDSATKDSLPRQALTDKVLEGAAKHVPAPRIVAAVRALAQELRETRQVLRAAAPKAPLSDDEIVAAADARDRGVPTTELALLRSHVEPAGGLVVAFTVLGDLVQRGVRADQARTVIEQLLAAGVPGSQLGEIPSRMDVGLRLGAPPTDALRNALPEPLRPVKPAPPGRP